MEYLEQKLRIKRLFDKEAKLPTTPDECKPWFGALACDLSPENLHCDGEITVAAARKKAKEIHKAWKYLEGIYGQEVDEFQALMW